MAMINNLIWIDQNVENEDNKSFIKEIKNKFKINVTIFSDIELGLNYILNNLKFKSFLVVVSGKYFPSYIEGLNKNINNLASVPISIVFTFYKNLYTKFSICKEKIGDKFFNPGGLADSFIEIEEFISRYLKIKSSKFKKEALKKPTNYDSCYSFEYITNDCQLIYPSIYNEIITNKKIEREEIESFNCFLKENFGDKINELIKPLNLTKNIPPEILSKYYVYAYSLETPFYHILNRDLMLLKGEKYYPFIKTLYKGMNYYHYKDLESPLYRRSRISEEEIKRLEEILKNKDKYNDKNSVNTSIPKILFYSRTFLSFSKKKEKAMGFNGNVLFELQLNYLNLKEIQSNASIEKFSSYSDEEEVLFYPYSSFSIESITKEDNLVKIVLVSLGKYKEITKKVMDKYKDDFISFQKQASNSNFYKEINKSNYIKPKDALEISYPKISGKNFDSELLRDFIDEDFEKEKIKICSISKIEFEEDVNEEISFKTVLDSKVKSELIFVLPFSFLYIKKQKRKIKNISKYNANYNIYSDGTKEEISRNLIKKEKIYGEWEDC